MLCLRQTNGFINIIMCAIQRARLISVKTADVGQAHNLVVLVAQLVVQVKRLLVFPDFQVGIV